MNKRRTRSAIKNSASASERLERLRHLSAYEQVQLLTSNPLSVSSVDNEESISVCEPESRHEPQDYLPSILPPIPTLQMKKKKRSPGVVAAKEIHHYQSTTDKLIRKIPFWRLVKEITHSINPDLRFQQSAIDALQTASEDYIVTNFEQAQACANHAKRVTVYPSDINLAMKIRGDKNYID